MHAASVEAGEEHEESHWLSDQKSRQSRRMAEIRVYVRTSFGNVPSVGGRNETGGTSECVGLSPSGEATARAGAE